MEGLIPSHTEGLNPKKTLENLSAHNLDAPLEKEPLSTGDTHEGKQSEWTNEVTLPERELNTPLNETSIPEKVGLNDDQKSALKEKTGWSDSIIDAIQSEEEASIYRNDNLIEVNNNLERTDIDWNAPIPQDRIDRMRALYGDEIADKWAGKTNMDLIKEGKAPYGPDGERINLHHIGQKTDSPLAELTNTEHKKYDAILHDKSKTSEIERPVFQSERKQYWQARYDALTNN